ncbi:ubiquitin-like-conjugating enzyme ATG10 isoform X1 [Astyanax mexicanus]|uniref:Ubiquitin-like-conjugating enzyme ATG10 n=2 Tax=Astyanax mexicanus TaxID=7994 RepID=A0A8B9J7Q9_ASTMX|nr:ubiquitin-like-conjugating enzyme ATG10 isoform X1 [Astyanax mexicanus]KAG9262927.1 ubiquitin-like-conjugating enzyme ATG10 isoform X1 [Astyanax mexicanus]
MTHLTRCVEMSDDGVLDPGHFHLDEKSFRFCCQSFLQHSDLLSDGWSWTEVKGSEGFMKKTVLRPRRNSPLKTEALDFMTEEEKVEEEEEEDAQVECEKQDVVVYEYHVLYSSSYQVPVLYFTASTLDGRLLSLEEVWNSVHPDCRTQLLNEPWNTLTQQEHPVLGQPFFMLHPCRTEEFMQPILETARREKRRINYVVTWLSVVGPMVRLVVPVSYCTVPDQNRV